MKINFLSNKFLFAMSTLILFCFSLLYNNLYWPLTILSLASFSISFLLIGDEFLVKDKPSKKQEMKR